MSIAFFLLSYRLQYRIQFDKDNPLRIYVSIFLPTIRQKWHDTTFLQILEIVSGYFNFIAAFSSILLRI